MELAIPLVALGGMYVISNQDKVKAADPNQQKQNMLSTKREGFTSKDSQLPNKQITPQNYPVTHQKALGNTVHKELVKLIAEKLLNYDSLSLIKNISTDKEKLPA